MKITKGEIAVFAIAMAAFIVGACFYSYLPERMASHWNARGQVDGYMSKAGGAFLMPIVISGLGLLFMIIVRVDPLKANIEKFRKYYDGFIILFSVFLFCIHLWVLLWNIGYKLSLNRIIPLGLGLLFFYLGILCENVKRNWFIGIRTPWTLSSDIVWARTHKVGAKLFKAVGIVILAGAIWPAYLLWFILIPTILVTVFLLVYSYVVYQRVGEIGETAGCLNDESENGKWNSVKAGYLEQVQKVLASAGNREKKQVLEDVSSHLDSRYAELSEDERTWENFQQIITEMGPASDYAELLETGNPEKRKYTRPKSQYISFAIGVIVIIIASAILSKKITSSKIGHVIGLKADMAIEDVRIQPYQQGGLYTVTVSIRNKGKSSSPKFGVYFYQGDPSEVEPMTHGAGPIEPGDVWNERSMPFALKEGTNQITAIIDPDNSVAESDENNNHAWIRLVVNENRITDKTTGFGKSRMQKKPTKDGVDSARTWLMLIDNGNYGESWEGAAEVFKKAATKERWTDMAKTVRQPLGKVVSRQLISNTPTKTVPGGPDGEYVIIQFKTSFENKKDAIETVTPMLDKDGAWRVSGYYIK
ncbi:MAG: DUF4019 domain-containing protein [Planctomycetota bacterium]|jgi:uncharacterized membrane protein